MRSSVLPVWVILLLVVGLVGCSANDEPENSSDSSSEEAASEERAQPIGAVELRPRDLSRVITVSGPIEPLRTVALASQMTGTVAEVRVEEGDRVRAGDVLARFDLSEQQAELDRARALEEKERAAYERVKELQEREFSSQAEYEQQKADLAVAESDVRLWERRVAFGTLTAPSDGIVTARHIEPGEAVAANDAAFALANTGALVLRVGVSELNIGGLAPGDDVSVRLDALPDQTFDASIRRIFPQADTDSRQVRVEVELDPASEAITQVRPGFLARATLTIDRREGVLAVPTEALLASDADEDILFVIEDDHLVRKPVTVGGSARGWTEILGGVTEGMYAVASNPANFNEGQRVRIASVVRHRSDPEDAEHDVPTEVAPDTAEVPAAPAAQQ